MGYDLRNDRGEELRFSVGGWLLALEVARRGGWRPQGTLRPAGYPADGQWGGEYAGNDGRRVSSSDATALVLALESALADPGFDEKTKVDANHLERELAERYPRYVPHDYSLADAAGFRRALRALIELARDGGFVIR